MALRLKVYVVSNFVDSAPIYSNMVSNERASQKLSIDVLFIGVDPVFLGEVQNCVI